MENNQQYLGNPNLKKANIKVEWTKEEVEEYQKCMQDPQHFIENHVRIISLDEGLGETIEWFNSNYKEIRK